MLCEKLPGRVSIDANIGIQPQRRPAPDLAILFFFLVRVFFLPFIIKTPSFKNKFFQRGPTPQGLREEGILDLKPVIDAHRLILALGFGGRRDQRQRRQERDVALTQVGREEVADEVDLLVEEGLQRQIGRGD